MTKLDVNFELSYRSFWDQITVPTAYREYFKDQRKEILLENKIYEKLSDLKKEKEIFEDHNNISTNELTFYNDVLNEKMHSLELTNWLNHNN